MIPKSRRDILNVCYDNFSNYSTLTKILIIASVVLSAVTFSLYICIYVVPTLRDIVNGDIIGWYIVWRVCFGFILYYVWKLSNMICVSIGGSAMCIEENWDTLDFAKAWVDIYEYEKHINNDENFEK
jgi:hypothetical protein